METIIIIILCLIILFSFIQIYKIKSKPLKIDSIDKKQEILTYLNYIIKYSIDIVILFDSKMKIIDANEIAISFYGYSREEMLKLSIYDLRSPENKNDIEYMRDITKLGNPLIFETKHLKKDGTLAMVEVNTLLIDLEDKKYYKSIIRDITERKKLEIQLTAERYQLRTIIDASPASIWFKDTHNNFIHVNKAAARIANRRVNEIEGKPTDEIFPVESDKYFTDDLEVINSGKPKLNIIESVTVGDKVRWVRTDKIPWLDTNHKIAGVIAFALDITNVIQYGKKIKMLAQAVESVSECVTITDMEDKIIFVNKAFIQTYGFSKEELIGKNIKIVRPQLPNTTYDEILRETLKGGWKGELINMKKDGTVFPVHLSTSVIKDEKDNPVALIGIVFDITKLKNQMNTF